MPDAHLAHGGHLAGDYSIADIANWCRVRSRNWSGAGIDQFPHLRRRIAAIEPRPAVPAGVRVPTADNWNLICGSGGTPGPQRGEGTRRERPSVSRGASP